MIKLELILNNSLLIAGVHVLFWPGMILSSLTKYLIRLPLLVRKPLFECLICMSSIWGTAFFLSLNGLSLKLIPHVLAVCGCNLILDSCIHYWRRGGNRQLESSTQPYFFESTNEKDRLK